MTTKIKTITPKTYKGETTGYSIELEDGTTGYLADKTSDKDLKVGEVVNATLEVKKNKHGADYNLLTIKRGVAGGQTNNATQQPSQPIRAPQAQNNPPMPANDSGILTPVAIFNKKAEFLTSLMQVLVEQYADGKIDSDRAKETWNYWKNEGFLGINEITSNK